MNYKDVYTCNPEFEVTKIIVKKMPSICHPEHCYFSWISRSGDLFCHGRHNRLIRNIRKSKDFSIPTLCPLEEES